jgi:hypothetical protein
MKSCSVRRFSPGLTALVASTLIVGCQDKRVGQLDTGIGRDSVLQILTEGATRSATDSIPNVYKRSRYLMDGKEYEILYFTPKNVRSGATKDSIPMRELTPVVLSGDKLIGRGWAFWDSRSLAHKRPVDKR